MAYLISFASYTLLGLLLTLVQVSTSFPSVNSTLPDDTISGANISSQPDTVTVAVGRATTANQQEVQTTLNRCKYEFKSEFTESLYEKDNRFIPGFDMTFTILAYQSVCYLTRSDIENKVNQSITETVIGNFWFVCPGDLDTQIVFLEDSQAEYHSVQNRNATNQQVTYKKFDKYVSYFKSKGCGIGLKGIEIVANITDLYVVILTGDKSLNLSEVQGRPELCHAFTDVASFGLLHDSTAPQHLHFLALCADHLHNMAEIGLINDSLTSFPETLKTAMPNLRSLVMIGNKLTSPLTLPWPHGYVELPRNLSRTIKFNALYNFDDSIDIQANLFRRVYSLDNNNISSLTTFQLHGECQYISFSKNGMREISQTAFENVTDLQYLSLSYNNLETLPQGLFAGLRELRRLDLENNKLKQLPINIFQNLRNLKRLNLAQNQLVVIQDPIFSSLEKLTSLTLNDNSITQLTLAGLSRQSAQLKTVSLQNNPINEFPVDVLFMRGMEEVNLDNTSITVLDFADIDRRTNLIDLGRSLVNPSVAIAKVDDDPVVRKRIFLRNSQLRSMVMYNRTRESLETFIYLVKFYSIFLQGSSLVCDSDILNVTHEVQSLEARGILRGDETCLTQWSCAWPEELRGRLVARLQDEETYSLLEEQGGTNASCPALCTCYLRSRVNTVIVDCQNAGLTSMPPYVPLNTRELWLQNNTIKTVDKLPYLQHLLDLKLSSNNVQDLPSDLLVFMKDLRLLFIDDNWLTGLGSQVENVQHVRLSGNPFRCDCKTLWMKKWLLSRQSAVLDWQAIKCSTEDKEGQVFVTVADAQFICKTSASLGQLAVPIAIPVTLCVVIITLCVVAFLQRRRLKVFIYIHTGLHPFDRDPPDNQATYDITVCCDIALRGWVLDNVVKPLEDHGYHTFFYHRDARLGFTTLENIRDCVQHSRRLVAVLGRPDWDTDDLLATATREALTKCRKEMVHFMALVVHQFSAKEISNKDLQELIKTKRYIHTQDKHFFKKLLYEMPAVSDAECSSSHGGQFKQVDKAVALSDVQIITDGSHKGHNNNYSGDARCTDNGTCVLKLFPEGQSFEGEQRGNWKTEQRQNCVDDYHSTGGEQGHGEGPHGSNQGDAMSSEYQNTAGGTENETQFSHMTTEAEPAHGGTSALQNAGTMNPKANARSVFVWYADTDLPFTRTNILEPLEELGHKCILQDRDFLLGAPIQENIVHAAETCTRSVFVLSNQTADNDWFTFAFHVTVERHLQSHEQRMVLVMRDELDVCRFPDEVQQAISASALLTEEDPWFQERLVKFVENH